jgi:ATP-dependent exoDNAse (exonuclease V) beta subunit
LASKARFTPEVDQVEFEVITIASEGDRPATRNFGSLVHALLESWSESAAHRIAELHGRRIGATEREVTSAVAVARAAMQHALLNPTNAVAVHREYPISVTMANGEIVEGVIDLAWSDGESWTVIDYKTGRADPQHKIQVQLYALALQRATGLPARAVVLAV